MNIKKLLLTFTFALTAISLPVCADSPEPLHGFVDLYWGEMLPEIQREYKIGFAEYIVGGANYFIEIPEAHGFLGFDGQVTPVAHFVAGRLENIRLSIEKPIYYREKISESFGDPEVIRGKKYTSYLWKTEDSTILLRDTRKNGTLFIFRNQT